MIEGIGYKRTLLQSVVILVEGDVLISRQSSKLDTASCDVHEQTNEL